MACLMASSSPRGSSACVARAAAVGSISALARRPRPSSTSRMMSPASIRRHLGGARIFLRDDDDDNGGAERACFSWRWPVAAAGVGGALMA